MTIEEAVQACVDLSGYAPDATHEAYRAIVTHVVRDAERRGFVAGWDAQRRREPSDSTNPLLAALDAWQEDVSRG